MANSADQQVNPTAGAQIWDRLKFALVQQAIILVLAGMILDGGVMGMVCLFGSAAFWATVGLIYLRRRSGLSSFDMAYLSSGPLLLCVVSYFLTRFVWALRGYMLP